MKKIKNPKVEEIKKAIKNGTYDMKKANFQALRYANPSSNRRSCRQNRRQSVGSAYKVIEYGKE